MTKHQSVVLVSRSFDEAAKLMWNYYSDNKLILRSNIKQSREYVLQELMQGRPVADVFAPFFLSQAEINAMLKQSQKIRKIRA